MPKKTEELLARARENDTDALEELVDYLYDELRRVARSRRRRFDPGTQIETTELVAEAWLRFTGKELRAVNRHEFLSFFSKIMLTHLNAVYRKRMASKRGAGARANTFVEDLMGPRGQADEKLEDLSEGLRQLIIFGKSKESRAGKVVLLRHLSGLSIDETARVLEISAGTVKRDWQWARAWLLRFIQGED